MTRLTKKMKDMLTFIGSMRNDTMLEPHRQTSRALESLGLVSIKEESYDTESATLTIAGRKLVAGLTS